MEIYNRDILTKKDGKFSRDRGAFEENCAYKWSVDQQHKKNRGFRRRKDHYSAISNSSSSLSTVSSQVPPKNKKAPCLNRGDNRPQGQKTNTDNAPGCSSSTVMVTGRVPAVVMGSTVSSHVPLQGACGNSLPVTSSRTTQGMDRSESAPLVEAILNKLPNKI